MSPARPCGLATMEALMIAAAIQTLQPQALQPQALQYVTFQDIRGDLVLAEITRRLSTERRVHEMPVGGNRLSDDALIFVVNCLFLTIRKGANGIQLELRK